MPVWVLACAAVMFVTLAGAWKWEQHRRADRFRGGTYKIGVVQNPPIYDWSAQRGAIGFAVDVMNEAARRAASFNTSTEKPIAPFCSTQS